MSLTGCTIARTPYLYIALHLAVVLHFIKLGP
jgi:hypothetical protein